MSELVLSCFAGVGLLDRAFEETGFTVVRGPDLLWGGDIRGWHVPARRFDGVIGGPPCQPFSRLRHLVEHNGYTVAEDLIPEFERVIAESEAAWFLMENVPAAPIPQVRGYWPARTLLLNNRWLGEEQNRVRRFSFGMRFDLDPVALDISPDIVAFEAATYEPAVLANGGRRVPVAIGGSGKVKASRARDIGYVSGAYWEHSKRVQGLPADFDLPGFTTRAKVKAINNGVPIPMGRAIANAVKRALAGEVGR